MRAENDWAPDACTLPTPERPLRVAEFDALFAHVLRMQRPDPTRLDLVIPREAEASARDIAGLITQIRTSKIPAVFLENISDPRLMRRISAETGARIGGTLYSDSLTGEKGDAPTYIDMVKHNIKALTSALSN